MVTETQLEEAQLKPTTWLNGKISLQLRKTKECSVNLLPLSLPLFLQIILLPLMHCWPIPSPGMSVAGRQESRKTKQVTMNANCIYFRGVESEFVTKKSIFPWTSELSWIWHFLRNLDYFWALFYWQCWLQKTEALVLLVQSRALKNSQILL